jgi:peptidoglycan hydrolase-like protein with peptidoglycan-binding domain
LTQQNYNPGSVDGLMGKKTRIALEKYQKDHQLFVTGCIDAETLIALGLLQPSRPADEVVVGNEHWGEEPEPQINAENGIQVPATENPQQEISNDSLKKDPHIYVKTIGVAYLQMADNIYADIFAKIPAGTLLQVLAETSEWYKVSYQNKVGYVLSEAVVKQ